MSTSTAALARHVVGKRLGSLQLSNSKRTSLEVLGTHHRYFLDGISSQDRHRYDHRQSSGGSCRYGSTFAAAHLAGGIPGPLSAASREDDRAPRSRGGRVVAHHGGDRRRHYHVTAPSERAVAVIMGLATVSAVAYAGSSAIQSYNEWKAAQPTEEELDAMRAEEEKERSAQEAMRNERQGEQQAETEREGPRQNIFHEWFDVGSKYYEGGFEDTMTKREAALILGVRESSSHQRIKDAHRKLLILNHPDTGGSTYIAGKINEAKELLLKGRQRM